MAEEITRHCKKHGAYTTFHCHQCKIESGKQSWKNRTPEKRADKENEQRRQAATERILQVVYRRLRAEAHDSPLVRLYEELLAAGWQPEGEKK